MFQPLILASASPRRREILEQVGIPFTIQVADFDEESVRKELEVEEWKKAEGKVLRKESERMDSAGGADSIEGDRTKEDDYPVRYVKALALGKARAVLKENADIAGVVVLGADTVVVHRGEILNKPIDIADARRMLLHLQGDVHAVYTGVALCCRTESPDNLCVFANFAVRTEVVFYPMDELEIEEYLACGEYVDKAGAYAIQGKMAAYIKEIHGDYYNVVGLPLSAIVQELRRLQKNV